MESDFTLKAMMRQNRSMKFFISAFLILFSCVVLSAYDESVLIDETDFQNLAVEMKQKQMGLVMMLHAEDCPYCDLMDEKVLSPMERSGDYENKVLIRKLQIDKSEFVTNFQGEIVGASEFAEAYDSRITPTLVFLDHDGNERALKIIGVDTIDFLSVSVDEQIEILVSAIKQL